MVRHVVLKMHVLMVVDPDWIPLTITVGKSLRRIKLILRDMIGRRRRRGELHAQHLSCDIMIHRLRKKKKGRELAGGPPSIKGSRDLLLLKFLYSIYN